MNKLMIGTCQISKRAGAKIHLHGRRGVNPFFLDITVKSGEKIFAPTWDMVMGYKKGTLTKTGYTEMYQEMMRESYRVNKTRWENLIRGAIEAQRPVILCCYCRAGDFCHRYLLREYLIKVAESMGFETEEVYNR